MYTPNAENAARAPRRLVIEDESSPTPAYVGEASFEERNAALKALAIEAGIRLPDTRVPEGESLLPIGEENKRKLASDVAKLPGVSDGLTALRSVITAQDARDSKVQIQRVRMDSERAGLFGPGQNASDALAYTDSGFGHVVSYLDGPRGTAGVLASLRPAARAAAFNDLAERARRNDAVVIRTIVEPRSGRRVVRAVTSERHSLTTGDDTVIADAIAASVPAGAKLRVTKTPDRSDFELVWPAMDRELRVGDVALIALSISNSETKAGSLKVAPKLLRVLCYNFTTAYSEGADEEISLKHVGDLRTKLPAAFARALKVVDPFVRAFGDAYKAAFPTFAPTRGELLDRVAKKFELAESTLDLSGQLWDADGSKTAGDTLAGLVNALTRASQEQTMESAAVTERAAGRLIVEGWGALA